MSHEGRGTGSTARARHATCAPMLPEHLAERVAPGAGAPRRDGHWVVYWMRTAVRAEENPALDVALALAAALDVPAFVYHALDERYPYASDRHHTFILEGARDVQAALAARGIGYAFHLAREGHRGPHLLTLAARACVVVTEDFPWQPMERWIERVAAAAHAPVWRVDTACVVPFRRVGRAYERAFAFRDATKAEFEARVHRAWTDVEPNTPPFVPDLPFTPIELERTELSSLVAACTIDHGVGPIHHTPGGSARGRARWQHFLEHGLARYAEERSNPLRPAGASRLSAYLHYGMVSPLRVAREAAGHRTDGAAKFLDELHTWREVTWSFCAFTPNHERVSCLPGWARATLEAHARDPRPALPSWETLARGRTDDEFWNLLQASLRIHGELHNQVRMTWGKALLPWTPHAQRALDLLLDLNHRYALDGRDPGSFGGILWCLGVFDRPHGPERPIFGSVRTRPTAVFSQRLDTAEYGRRVRRPVRGVVEHVAVVGAGPAGCMLARTLEDAGHRVTLFDRGKAPGGRMSTRRITVSAAPDEPDALDAAGALSFDHGAPLLTLRDARLAPFLESWRHEGVLGAVSSRVRRPNGAVELVERLVGTPRMSALVAHLARDLTVVPRCDIVGIHGGPGRYRLVHHDGAIDETFTQVALCLPAPQAIPLVASLAPALADALGPARYAPRFVAMAAFAAHLALEDVVLMEDPALAFTVREAVKPGRARGERLVLHATGAWSRAHIQDDAHACAPILLEALWRATRLPRAEPQHLAAHRWRYAVVETPLPGTCLFDDALKLGVAGDAFGTEGVETALLSARALAGRFLGLPADDDASLLKLDGHRGPVQMTIW